jgi:hypothetical protein
MEITHTNFKSKSGNERVNSIRARRNAARAGRGRRYRVPRQIDEMYPCTICDRPADMSAEELDV